ncbi:hypothetical protein [Zavarzinella formosa]|uniref:hypothetical protein n=1 Tax=Zavarzinella formosa TaxID=360055 RepID=UPI000364618D|nr:hypothetical protein [Zavarzinella formosa]
MTRFRWALLLGMLTVPALAQDPAAGHAQIQESVLNSLYALGASNGVPDGLGVEWLPKQHVRGQQTALGMLTSQGGLTVPVMDEGADQLFALASTRWVNLRTQAILPTDHVPLANNWYDIQAGGLFVHQMDRGWSWGVSLTGGSISDRPFQTLNEVAVNSLVFLRTPANGDDAWLFYVVSATNGQIGRNIPIPGLAYEFKTTDWKGSVGFPFVNLNYRPPGDWGWELNYAALTDIQTRVNWYPTDYARAYGGFAWTNQAWFRSDRPSRNDQFFYYEKRLDTGLVLIPTPGVNVELGGGYAFDRYFFETQTFSLSGRNRVDVGNGPFVRFQIELKY